MENVTTAPNPILWLSVYTFLNFCTCADIKNKFGYWFLLAILLWQDKHWNVHHFLYYISENMLLLQQKLRLQV